MPNETVASKTFTARDIADDQLCEVVLASFAQGLQDEVKRLESQFKSDVAEITAKWVEERDSLRQQLTQLAATERQLREALIWMKENTNKCYPLEQSRRLEALSLPPSDALKEIIDFLYLVRAELEEYQDDAIPNKFAYAANSLVPRATQLLQSIGEK